MARTFYPDTYQISFDNREDLSPEFDVVQPDGFKWGFQLPRDVDFYVHLGRHTVEEDVAQARAFVEDVHPDLFLFETPSDEFSQRMLDYASSGDKSEMSVSVEWLKRLCPPRKLGFNLAIIQCIYDNKLKTLAADPPLEHKSIRDSDAAQAINCPDTIEEYYAKMRLAMDARDLWLLHNLGKMVDKNVPYQEGERRKVQIFRGGCHFRFLRALEYQIEFNPHKANGSAIVASVVDFAYPDGNYTEDIMFEKPE